MQHVLRIIALSCFAMTLTATATFAQQEVQQLAGDYLGLAALDPKLPAVDVVLEVTDSHDRRFEGRLAITIQDNFLPIQGTIAASGKCTIQADGNDERTSLYLDWMNLGGAGVLLGAAVEIEPDGASTDAEPQRRAPIALLRSFDVRGVRWIGGQELVGTRTSVFGGAGRALVLKLTAGDLGLLQGCLPGDLLLGPDLLVTGTSDDGGKTVMVGAHPDGVVLMAGQVKINERSEPVSFAGDYLIETAGGKLLDAGTFVLAAAK